ncbi:hypothetical protein ACPPVU_20185 [Mucilaginibacter sp. McL0603]|uniref:hypothetical protein n=1 Tax=Mucilaginibacter sp. McL0603 TaxID=3415670 RepID=UPI003CE98BCA
MIALNNNKLVNKKFSNVFIVENRNLWQQDIFKCNKNTDLVLCLDFALKTELQIAGYQVEFLDHLVSNEVLEGLNFEMYEFLDNWFKDEKGKDLLNYKGFNLGDSHLLFILNEVDYFCHFFFNIIALKFISYEKLFVSVEEPHIISCLDKFELPYSLISPTRVKKDSVYLFPILKWISEKTQRTTWSFTFKNSIANCFDLVFRITDRFLNRGKKYIYIHKYHPTMQIVKQLQTIKGIQLVFNNYSGLKDIWNERRVHYKHKKDNFKIADSLRRDFIKTRCFKWYYDNYPLSEYLYEIIDKILEQKLKLTIDAADSINDFFKRYQIDLMIPVTNLWVENRLMMDYCQRKNIPIFMILNGILINSFFNDAKDSDYVNCYSESIKTNYFNSADYAIPLGDARMDKYVNLVNKEINYVDPVLIIGAAGFSPIDLNSYLAFEFDFLFDILNNVQKLSKTGKNSKVILKVRGNGYVDLYSSFINEYFNDLNVEITQAQNFSELIVKADLYISFFSQTIFEASCLGIPVIYYKKDTHFMHEPFNNKSELMTATNEIELMHLFQLFYEKSPEFELFKSKDVMKKYIGYLDGNNTSRNVEFIRNLVNSN